ncbi:hypothetical protein [Corynebacterium glutamicum]|nr:hypothetical protein [Corynebacterium glutamicum]EGV41928.1 hypothetical protein CgS9114_00885 [Corynebacterium glutamicum S9114]NII86287.1 hypothetical protein [Corynebacterium glutamicum]
MKNEGFTVEVFNERHQVINVNATTFELCNYLLSFPMLVVPSSNSIKRI